MNRVFGPWAIRFRLPFDLRQPGIPGLEFPSKYQSSKTNRHHYGHLIASVFLTCLAGLTASSAHGAGTLSFSPTAANFGNVPVGTTKSITTTITNTGTAS